jgi:thiol-disulfide isomerase/thioredoxin
MENKRYREIGGQTFVCVQGDVRGAWPMMLSDYKYCSSAAHQATFAQPYSTTMSQTAENFHVVESPEQFQQLLSADLERISLLNFWASWAEPCAQMNEVVAELAKTNPKLLTLQVCVWNFT